MSTGGPRDPRPRLTPVDFDPFASASERATLPLTGPQQEVWAAVQMGADASTAYNQCFPIRLRGALSAESLRTALDQVTRRHDALRVTFAPSGEEQRIAATASIPLTTVDVSSDAPTAQRAAVAELVAREVRQPFDLASGPLVRAHLVRESDDSHVLVITAHHLVCDGWSSGIVLHDLAAFYSSDRHGMPAHLSAVMPYAEYVTGCVNDPEQAESDRYWVQRFADGAPVLQLPTDRPHAPVRTFAGSHERVTIEPALYREIKSLGARHGCTLYVTLLAAWQVLLSRLTRQTDVVVGIPVAGQASLANGNLVGHGVHMLPLRLTIDSTTTMAQHLAAARSALLEAHEHRAITFGRLIRQLNLPRDSSHTPLLAAVFNVDRPTDPPVFEGLTVEKLVPPRAAYSFEIGLDIADTGAELLVECNYNVDLFDGTTIRRWLTYYTTLLTSAIANPAMPIGRLALMPSDETAALRESGMARRSFDQPCVHHAFERTAAQAPDAIAVTFENESISYSALNRRANQIAHRMRDMGVQRETLVGICLERSVDLVAAIVGVLKAGGAYLPLDPDCPTDRVAMMIDDAQPRVIVASNATAHHFTSTESRVLNLDGDGSTLTTQPETNPGDTSVKGSDLAYVIYTSGSTGRPKGVAVTHGNVARLFTATEEWYGFDRHDVWTLFHSFAFDFSVWEIWGALRYGGRLVVVPQAITRSPDAFHELLRRERVTVLNQTPSAFRQLIEADRNADAPLDALRLVIFGGEALDVSALRGWFDRHGDERPTLVNMYGITETTVHVTYRPIRMADLEAGGRSPIGVPIPDLDLYLLDPDTGELVAPGVGGEICVGGPGVARGYLNRAELTSARFIQHPFTARGGERLYRSGDLARRRADGDLDYLGRIDHQVKIRGFRIELGEIEAALLRHRSVREAAVLLTTSGAGDPRLVAYVVPAAGVELQPSDLLTHLRASLPEYMVPSAFVPLEALPINENGKLDRRRLPAIDTRVTTTVAPVAPRTPTEEALAEIWRDALELAYVGVDDSFFDLGGHSMLAVRIVARARERFSVELPVAALFRAPTIALLAEAIDAIKLTAAPAERRSENREVFEL